MIYKLCIKYTREPKEVDDNYVEALANFFKYMDSYDESKSIKTWIHIVTKRFVFNADHDRRLLQRNDDVDIDDYADEVIDEDNEGSNSMGMDNYKTLYNDDILAALANIKPIYRDALLLQQAGYKLNEIVEISFQNGTLKTRNIETVKSRLFLAKKQMREAITRNGEKKGRAE